MLPEREHVSQGKRHDLCNELATVWLRPALLSLDALDLNQQAVRATRQFNDFGAKWVGAVSLRRSLDVSRIRS